MQYDNWFNKENLRNPRTIVNDLPTVLVDIEGYTESQTDTGEIDKTWSVRLSDIETIYQKSQLRERENQAGPYSDITHYFYFNFDVDIRTTDRIVGDIGTFEIIDVQKDSNKDILTVYTKQILQ